MKKRMTLLTRNSFSMMGNYTSRRNGHWPGGAIYRAFQRGEGKGSGQTGKPQERAAPRETEGCPGAGERGRAPAGLQARFLGPKGTATDHRILEECPLKGNCVIFLITY